MGDRSWCVIPQSFTASLSRDAAEQHVSLTACVGRLARTNHDIPGNLTYLVPRDELAARNWMNLYRAVLHASQSLAAHIGQGERLCGGGPRTGPSASRCSPILPSAACRPKRLADANYD